MMIFSLLSPDFCETLGIKIVAIIDNKFQHFCLKITFNFAAIIYYACINSLFTLVVCVNNQMTGQHSAINSDMSGTSHLLLNVNMINCCHIIMAQAGC